MVKGGWILNMVNLPEQSVQQTIMAVDEVATYGEVDLQLQAFVSDIIYYLFYSNTSTIRDMVQTGQVDAQVVQVTITNEFATQSKYLVGSIYTSLVNPKLTINDIYLYQSVLYLKLTINASGVDGRTLITKVVEIDVK
jgi:hypothetical protein